MKKIIILLCISLFVMESHAKTSSIIKKNHKQFLKKSLKKNTVTPYVSREECTVGGYNSAGQFVTVTAYSGWFLSNSVNSHQRACEKAWAAWNATNDPPNP